MTSEVLSRAEALRAAGWTVMEDSGFIGLVGPLWISPERPERRFAFVAEDKHRNRSGNVQGGMLMTFADRSLGYASRSVDPTIAAQATATMTFDFIDSGHIGELIVIDCEVLRRTRTLVFMRGTLTSGDRLIGTASGIWKIRSLNG
jgi:acyl-coenzyme A thioesterase PaaI-like protein